MARPIWKGYITFGLVNIPVILYPAEKSSDIQFKLVDSRDKSKIHYVRVNDRTGEEVPWSEVAKGYEYADDNFVLLKDEDIKAIAGENTKTIGIECFISKKNLDYMDFEKPYYLIPDKKGEKGYVILREVLKSTNKVGIAKVMIHTKQYLAALMPYENALVLHLLRYHEEIIKPAEFDLPNGSLKKYKITVKEVDVAKQLVNSMTTHWSPDHYKDEFKAALHEWLEEKINHAHPHAKMKQKVTGAKSNVVNFVDLFKKSLAEQKKIHKKNHSTFKKTAKMNHKS